MRIATSMLYNQAKDNIQKRRFESAKTSAQIATGQRINSLSDDPQGVRRVLVNESTMREVQSMERSADHAEHLLNHADSALAETANVTHRIYEMAVQFSSDTYSAQDRQGAADELVQLREQLVQLSNAEVDGRFIFGGAGNAGLPFDAAGVFSGDAGTFELPVGRRATVQAGLPGGEPFVDSGGGPTIFDTIDTLETALRADNTSAITGVIDEAEAGSSRVAGAQQALGIRYERLELVRSALSRSEVTASATLDAAKNTDYIEAVSYLRETEAGLQAALSVTARLGELSLTNFV